MLVHRVYRLILPICCLLLLSLITGCEKLKQATISYGDGSGNSYVITPEPRLEYLPIEPAMSSSGSYDGGEPVNRPLSAAEHDQILAVMRAGLENRAVHITDRVKMSGQIRVQHGDGNLAVVLKPGCAEQQAIETLLKSLR